MKTETVYNQLETKQKREYRKDNPLTKSEIDRRAIAKKIKSHKLIRTFIPYEIADEFKRQCEEWDITLQDAVAEAMLEYQEKHFTNKK